MNAPAKTKSGSALHRDSQLVVRLQESQLFRDYRSAFQTITGLPLVLRTAGSFLSPLAGSKQMNPFCALMAAGGRTCSACLQLQHRVESEASRESKTLKCFAGLSESAVPVRLGEKVVGYLQTGQVMFRAPTATGFRGTMRLLREWNPLGDEAELEAAYFKTPVLSRAHYDAAVRLLSCFAEHLSLLSNQLMIKKTAAEPSAVSKARAFIAENLAEPLSLTQVARAANTSAFYFCKIFKRTVGVSFTDYLGRMRVEKTKQLLLDPNVRVSEAAYAAGFQSLSQFNRVFRAVAGESPSGYRDHLHVLPVRSAVALAA